MPRRGEMRPARTRGLSRKGALFIGDGFEVYVSHLYNIFGNAHIGYGHMLHTGPYTKDDVRHWGGVVDGQDGYISKDGAAALLRRDAKPVIDRIHHTIPGVLVTQGQMDALISAGINLGPWWFEESALPGMMREGRYADARKELLRYDHARVDGEMVQVRGLTLRRRAEARLYRTGNYSLNKLLHKL